MQKNLNKNKLKKLKSYFSFQSKWSLNLSRKTRLQEELAGQEYHQFGSKQTPPVFFSTRVLLLSPSVLHPEPSVYIPLSLHYSAPPTHHHYRTTSTSRYHSRFA